MSLKNKIEKIIEAIKDTNINEIEISSFWGAQKIKLKKTVVSDKIVYETNERDSINIEKKSQDKQEDDTIVKEAVSVDNTDTIENYTIVKAPLVGTYYSSSKPGEAPFVDIGQSIKVGDALCIIEAMKIFNTIECEYNGEIKEAFVKDGDPVEFGQELFAIKELDV